MAIWIQPLQIKDSAGEPTGRWRLTSRSDESKDAPYALCPCLGGHESPEAAEQCEDAREAAEAFGS